MTAIVKCLETLRSQLERHRKTGLKEYPTRTIFIDPMLEALGWDVRDPDDVQLEYPTIDGKSVDYAMKVNRKVVLLVEAKQLCDPLEDVKAITQVVGYAANDGVEWCVLTNGVRYRVYKSTERANAPDKLLYEVSIDPKDADGQTTEELASQLSRLSRESMASGLLDKIGSEIFTTGKVRKALDQLFLQPPPALVRLVRRTLDDNTVPPAQITEALRRIWDATPDTPPRPAPPPVIGTPPPKAAGAKPSAATQYPESHHTDGKPTEVVEIYRALDRYCQSLAPGQVTRSYKKQYVGWALSKHTFCCAHLRRAGLRVWLKIDPKTLDPSITFARDVTKIGHWGVGDVELTINTQPRLKEAEPLLRQSFSHATTRPKTPSNHL